MAHISFDTFDRNYLSRHVRRDVQNLYQRQAEHPVVQSSAQMSVTMDSRAPYKLSPEQWALLKLDPDIIRLRKKSLLCSKEVREVHGTLKNSRGTNLHQKHKSARRALQANIKAKATELKLQLRDEYFKQILSGLLPLTSISQQGLLSR